MLPTSASRGKPIVLHDAASSGNGLALAIPNSFTQHKLTIKGSSGVASGAVQPESADVTDYAGTWNAIGGGPITVVASSEIEYNWTGLLSAIRARISTSIGSGTVTVTYTGS